MNNGPNLSLPVLPDELWKKIFSFINEKINLPDKHLNRLYREELEQRKWAPFFTQLKALEPNIVEPEENQAIADKYGTYLRQNFERMRKEQWQEIQCFIKGNSNSLLTNMLGIGPAQIYHIVPQNDEFILEKELSKQLTTFSPAKALHQYLEQENFLNKLNVLRFNFEMREIQYARLANTANNRTFDFTFYLTRIPTAIFESKYCSELLKQISSTTLNHNNILNFLNETDSIGLTFSQIKACPQLLKYCPNLKMIHCEVSPEKISELEKIIKESEYIPLKIKSVQYGYDIQVTKKQNPIMQVIRNKKSPIFAPSQHPIKANIVFGTFAIIGFTLLGLTFASAMIYSGCAMLCLATTLIARNQWYLKLLTNYEERHSKQNAPLSEQLIFQEGAASALSWKKTYLTTFKPANWSTFTAGYQSTLEGKTYQLCRKSRIHTG